MQSEAEVIVVPSKLLVLPALLYMVLLAQGGQTAGIDDVLHRARVEGKVVMLELGSVGCTPCEQMKPVMERLRSTYRDKLEVLFIDVRKEREISWRFGVVVIPTQVFLDRNGKEFHRHNGFYRYEDILPILKNVGME